MGTVTGKGKPEGFVVMPEGHQNLHITEVKGIPRENISVVTMMMHNEDGISLTGTRPQKYDLDTKGGYAAFYWLLKKAFDIDLAEVDEFDIDQLEDTYAICDIVHTVKEYEADEENDRPARKLTFANIKETIGPGTPFGEAAEDGGSWD